MVTYADASAKANNEPDHTREERLSNSAALIRQPFQPGDPEYGKVFLLGKPGRDDIKPHLQNITIAEETPTAVLDAKTRDELGLPTDHPTIEDVKAGKGPEGFRLISTGANLVVKNTRSGEDKIALMTQPDGGLAGPSQLSGGQLYNANVDTLNTNLAVLHRAHRGSKPELLMFDAIFRQTTTKADKEAQFPGVKDQIPADAPAWAKRGGQQGQVREVDAFPHQDTLDARQSIEILVGSPSYVLGGFPVDMKVDDEPGVISLRENIEIKVRDFDDVLVFDPAGQKSAALYTAEEALASKPTPDVARLASEQVVVKDVEAAAAVGPRVDAKPGQAPKA